MDTILSPNHDDINDYINIQAEIIRGMGLKVYDFSDFKSKPLQMRKLKIVNLNWYDDINEDSIIRALFVYVKKRLVIRFLKLFKVKIVYNLHNRMAHDGKSKKFNIGLKKFILKNADVIALLSMKSKEYAEEICNNCRKTESKFRYIGHPEFQCSYIPDMVPHENMTFIYFGAVKPYKNIELLINVWNELHFSDAVLMIVGKPVNEEYKKRIELLSTNNPSIKLFLKYVPNEELDQLIAMSDVVVCPLDKKSSMNSSTLIRSICMRRTIIIPDIEMIYDYDFSQAFVYKYKNDLDHEGQLKRKILATHDLYNDNPYELCHMGNKLYDSFVKINGDEKYRSRYIKMYQDIININSCTIR